MFTNKDPYNPTMPDVAAIAEIKAVDQISAIDTFNRYSQEVAGINDDIYEKYLDSGLRWLNDNIDSDKAKKMRDALYWFNFATDEQNLTNK
jgi:hypothetical protein